MKITALARGKSLLFLCENMAVLPDWGLLLSLSGSIAGEIGKIAVFFPADSDLLTGDGSNVTASATTHSPKSLVLEI